MDEVSAASYIIQKLLEQGLEYAALSWQTLLSMKEEAEVGPGALHRDIGQLLEGSHLGNARRIYRIKEYDRDQPTTQPRGVKQAFEFDEWHTSFSLTIFLPFRRGNCSH